MFLTHSSDHIFVFHIFLSCLQMYPVKVLFRLCLLRWADPHCCFQVRSPCPASFLFCWKGFHNATEAYCACADPGGECLQHLRLREQCQRLHFWDIYYIFKQFCSSLLLLSSILSLTSLFQVSHQQHCLLLSPLSSIIQRRLSRTWHSCHVWVAFKPCSRNLPFNLTYASKLPTQVTLSHFYKAAKHFAVSRKFMWSNTI